MKKELENNEIEDLELLAESKKILIEVENWRIIVDDFRKLINNLKPKFKAFHEWIDKQPNPIIYRGLRDSSITKLHEWLYNTRALEPKAINRQKISEINDKIKDAKRFKEAAKLYLKSTENFENESFVGTTWYAYFFYSLGKEPQLGRGVLTTSENLVANFENVPDSISKDYVGTYKHIHDDVIFFDLETGTKDRSLHIKVYCTDKKKDTILLGSYITYEDHHITSGSILLESTKDIDPLLIKPIIMSYKKNSDEFLKTNKDIIKYLSLRKFSFSERKRKITNNELLHEHVLVLNEEDWSQRFIDDTLPLMYLAAPSSTTKEKTIKDQNNVLINFVEELQSKYENKILVKHFLDSVESGIASTINESPSISIELLKRTRLFILIYSKTSKGSFSLVQLGLGITYCKSCLVFYEEGSLSFNVQKLRTLGVRIEPFSKFTEDGLNDVFKIIDIEIQKILEI
ncbi:MAG TPA: hypothetical protein VK590_16050 [Saprospiraceae bacterium]|nr:hypothetical protein [Saprospiraceae bacterium]